MDLSTVTPGCATLIHAKDFESVMTAHIFPPDITTAYGRIVEAEVAMEMVNRARTKLQDRIYTLEQSNPAEVDRLREVAIKLYDQLRSIDPGKPAHNAAIIASWKPLLQDEAMFWEAMRG